MTVVHMVLFKLKPEASQKQHDDLLAGLRALRKSQHVDGQRLVAGGPSISEPQESSQGFHYGLLSFHPTREALRAYQKSPEHDELLEKWLLPVKQELIRFDFEVDEAQVASFRGGLSGDGRADNV